MSGERAVALYRPDQGRAAPCLLQPVRQCRLEHCVLCYVAHVLQAHSRGAVAHIPIASLIPDLVAQSLLIGKLSTDTIASIRIAAVQNAGATKCFTCMCANGALLGSMSSQAPTSLNSCMLAGVMVLTLSSGTDGSGALMSGGAPLSRTTTLRSAVIGWDPVPHNYGGSMHAPVCRTCRCQSCAGTH